MAMLDDNGPSTIQEIANEAKISPERVKRILKSLQADAWVRRVSAEA
jgi:DNA-binding Lrp family transcriptional regulator